MFERSKRLRHQSEGLYTVMRGMDVQIGIFESRLNREENEYRRKELEAILRTLRYWREEVQKAYDGELHF